MPHLFCVLLNFLVVVTHKNVPSTMLRMVPLPRRGRGGWGSHVPSPCGDVVLKCGTGKTHLAVAILRFPSPCGDVVLKCSTEIIGRGIRMSFRPIAGICSIRLPRRNGGGGERCEPVGALVADVTFSRWRCVDRSRRPCYVVTFVKSKNEKI